MSIGAPAKVKLNISQLTLTRLAESGKHQSESQEIPGSISIAKCTKLFPT